MLIVDLRMGGNGKRTFTPERGLTEIEQRMVSDVAEAVLSQLPSVFGSVVSFQIGTPVQVASVQFLPPVRHTDMVLIVPINLEINEESTSSFDLCFPFSVVQPMVEALAIQRQDEEIPGGADAVAVAHCLLDTAVDIRVRFPSTSLTPADFLNLSVGDVVGLPYDQGDPLALMVSDQHHLDVLPTTSGKRLACVVVDQVEKH